MYEWIPISEQPPDIMNRPGRQFIRVEGWKYHRDVKWTRIHCDIAYIRKSPPFDYRQEDLDRIMRDGDMDGIDAITHWMPAIFPALP